jgi:hypothetical protein
MRLLRLLKAIRPNGRRVITMDSGIRAGLARQQNARAMKVLGSCDRKSES